MDKCNKLFFSEFSKLVTTVEAKTVTLLNVALNICK